MTECGSSELLRVVSHPRGWRRAFARLPMMLAALVIGLAASTSAAQTTGTGRDMSLEIGKMISRIDVVIDAGSATASAEVRQVVEQFVQAGNALEAEAVHDAIRRLTAAGLASRVRVDLSADPVRKDAVALTFRVTPLVRIATVRFDGIEAYQIEEVRGRLTALDAGQRLTEPLLAAGADEIVRYFLERGYFDASATWTTTTDPTGTRAVVVYRVKPGEQAKVSTFTISKTGASPPDVEKLLRLKTGARFTISDLEADLVTIREAYLRAGYLSPEVGRPDFVRNPAGGTVAVAVAVTSGPKVTVVVEGAEFKDAKLQQLLPVYSEGGLDEFQLSEGDRRLADALQRDGYFFARITHRVEMTEPDGARRVVYSIDRGRRYKITDIEIEGTSALSFADVRDDLQTKTAGFVFLARGLTSRDLIDRDATFLEERMRAIGFRKVAVVERRLGVAVDSDDLVITFVVEEGPRSTVADVVLEGNQIFSRDELLSTQALKPGATLDAANLQSDANRIMQKYAVEGFITAEVAPRIVDLDGDTVRVVYAIEEGNRAFVGQIVLTGNVRTRDASIRKYLEFKEGEVMRLDRLRLTEKNLYDSGAFREVLIRTEASGSAGDGFAELRTVYIDLIEASPWLLVYGGGFNTDDGPRGILEISNVNLFGRLNTGAVRLRMSKRLQLAQISYTNPNPFDSNLPLLGSIRFEREIKDAFSLLRFSTLLQVQKKLHDTLEFKEGFFFRYNFEQVRVFDLNLNPSDLEREDRPVRLGKLSTTYYRDSRNNLFDPDDGTFISLDGQIASAALGGNSRFVRFFGEYQRYDKVPKVARLTYALAAKLGTVRPYGASQDVPISERFFSGGARTLRGFGFEEAGPRDPVTDEPVGGNVLIVVNNELRFPITGLIGGQVFSDTGNVFRTWDKVRFKRVTETIGGGLRFETPVGPVRIDVGFLINGPSGAKGYAVHVSFGQAF